MTSTLSFEHLDETIRTSPTNLQDNFPVVLEIIKKLKGKDVRVWQDRLMYHIEIYDHDGFWVKGFSIPYD